MKKTIRPRKRKITAQDLFQMHVLTSVSISPDESRVAYTIERIDPDENNYFANTFMIDLKTDISTQFTHGPVQDGRSVWSPDGRTLAFVSTRDKKAGIYLMPTSGGAEKKLLEAEAQIGTLNWTPDGNNLIFSMRYKDSHFIKDEKKKSEPPVFRHITRYFYRLDGLGFIPLQPFHIYILNINTGQLKQLTKGRNDNTDPSVSSDGKWIAYVSNRSKDPDFDSLYQDIFIQPTKGGKEKCLMTPSGPKQAPRFSPDGRFLAYIGHDKPRDHWSVANHHIWMINLHTKMIAHDLMPGFDRSVIDQSIIDLAEGHGPASLSWSKDGTRLFFQSSDTGTTNFYSISPKGGKTLCIFKGNCHIKQFSINGNTRTAALIYADLDNPGDIMTCSTAGRSDVKSGKHTYLNKHLRKEIALAKTREVKFRSFDGVTVQGWLVTPPLFNENRKYPAILQIHGGPRVQYAYSFFHEMQYLAANGFVVFYTNPRGGAGRGEDWANAISGNWGDIDYKDLMAATDYLGRQEFVDSNRIGVTGGSYGGYMTNWIIGQTNRFKAAVTQRSICDLSSFVGTSDIGFALEREFKNWPWTNKEQYEKCSPMTYFPQVKTPVLILHNESDLRCHIEQGEQMFVMLKALGKKVEMVRFPEEPHGLSRHGRPNRRVARLEWMLKWFNQYLKK